MLLVLQLLKECSRGEENYDDLQGAQEMVQFQLRHGNDLLAMDSLRDCDVRQTNKSTVHANEALLWQTLLIAMYNPWTVLVCLCKKIKTSLNL